MTTKNTKTTLPACPFCAQAGELLNIAGDAEGRFVQCGLCGCAGPVGDTADEAVRRWGARFYENVLDELCDETQHRAGLVEGSLAGASSILWDNAGGITNAQVTTVACIVDLAIAELDRIGSHLDPIARRPVPVTETAAA
jgi:hypothetical protein